MSLQKAKKVKSTETPKPQGFRTTSGCDAARDVRKEDAGLDNVRPVRTDYGFKEKRDKREAAGRTRNVPVKSTEDIQAQQDAGLNRQCNSGTEYITPGCENPRQPRYSQEGFVSLCSECH